VGKLGKQGNPKVEKGGESLLSGEEKRLKGGVAYLKSIKRVRCWECRLYYRGHVRRSG